MLMLSDFFDYSNHFDRIYSKGCGFSENAVSWVFGFEHSRNVIFRIFEFEDANLQKKNEMKNARMLI